MEHPACSVFGTENRSDRKSMPKLYCLRVETKQKVRKKLYTLPSFSVLDAEAAKAELKAKGQPHDPRVQEMLRAIDKNSA
jgi:hypothetical protein